MANNVLFLQRAKVTLVTQSLLTCAAVNESGAGIVIASGSLLTLLNNRTQTSNATTSSGGVLQVVCTSRVSTDEAIILLKIATISGKEILFASSRRTIFLFDVSGTWGDGTLSAPLIGLVFDEPVKSFVTTSSHLFVGVGERQAQGRLDGHCRSRG